MSRTKNVRYESFFSFFSSVTWGQLSSGMKMKMNHLDEVCLGMQMNWSENNFSLSHFSSQQVFSERKRNLIHVIRFVPLCV